MKESEEEGSFGCQKLIIFTTVDNQESVKEDIMSYQYASIKLGGEDTVVDHGVLVTEEGDRLGAFPAILRKNLRPLIIAFFLLGAAVVATLASSFSEGQSSAQLNTVPLIGASKGTTRSCTFDECYQANCNIKVAPFICLRNNGGPHMGW